MADVVRPEEQQLEAKVDALAASEEMQHTATASEEMQHTATASEEMLAQCHHTLQTWQQGLASSSPGQQASHGHASLDASHPSASDAHHASASPPPMAWHSPSTRSELRGGNARFSPTTAALLSPRLLPSSHRVGFGESGAQGGEAVDVPVGMVSSEIDAEWQRLALSQQAGQQHALRLQQRETRLELGSLEVFVFVYVYVHICMYIRIYRMYVAPTARATCSNRLC